MERENVIEKFIERVEYELDELSFDIRETGMTDFAQGEAYGFIICLEILQPLLPKPRTLLNYDIEDKYKEWL